MRNYTYLLIAIEKERWLLDHSLCEILKILSLFMLKLSQ